MNIKRKNLQRAHFHFQFYAAQHSVQWSGGHAARLLSLFRDFEFSRFHTESRPTRLRLTQAVGQHYSGRFHSQMEHHTDEKEVFMNRDKKMILGYIVGGILIIVLVPSIIYGITSLCDSVYRIEVIQNAVIRWIVLMILLGTGSAYGIWSVIIQNTVGQGGPVEIGNIEISPKTKNLVVSGPYKYTRNPMLFGTFLMYLAFAFFMNSITAVLIVSAIFVFMLTVVVKMEEKRLLNDFGKPYEEYRKKVSMFIPWFQRKIE